MRMRALLFDVKGSREKTETFSRTHTIYLIWIYNYIHCCMCNNNNNIRSGGWDSWDWLLLVVSAGLFLRVSQFWKRPDTLWSSSCALPQGPLVLLVAGVSGWFWAELFGRVLALWNMDWFMRWGAIESLITMLYLLQIPQFVGFIHLPTDNRTNPSIYSSSPHKSFPTAMTALLPCTTSNHPKWPSIFYSYR